MANEHVKTAAANLERAAEDMRQQRRETENTIAQNKRDTAKTIDALQSQINQLQRNRNTASAAEKVVIDAQIQNLHIEITNIQQQSDQYIQQLQQTLNDLDGQTQNFESLASQLNNTA